MTEDKKMKCLIYVTKSKSWLFFDKSINYYSLSNKKVDNDLNGKIVAEFDGEVEEITKVRNYYDMKPEAFDNLYYTKTLDCEQLSISSCMTTEQFDNYLKDKNGYAIHIKNLNIFDKPKKLGMAHYTTLKSANKIQKAPQNMCIVRSYYPKNYFEKYVLISVRPEWACKILNGEKTIEVRKQVLNCMKGD